MDNMRVVIVISHGNECGQKMKFLNLKKCKFLDSISESQGAKNACGKVVYEEVN